MAAKKPDTAALLAQDLAAADPALRAKRAEHARLEAEVASLKRTRDRLAGSYTRGFWFGTAVGVVVDTLLGVGLIAYAIIHSLLTFRG
jgi:hypothetical protein